jgi:hypothetical protein
MAIMQIMSNNRVRADTNLCKEEFFWGGDFIVTKRDSNPKIAILGIRYAGERIAHTN